VISKKFRIGPFAKEISLPNIPVGRPIKRLKSKKEGRLIDNDSKNIYRKSCAALYKENWRLHVNSQSKRKSKKVIFAQMKPLITNLKLNNLIT